MPFYKTPLCLPSLFYSWKYSGKLTVPFRFNPQGVHFPFCSSKDCVTGQGTHFLNQLDDSVSHLQSIALTSFKQIEYCSFVCIVAIIYASKWHWDLMSKQGVWLIQGGKSGWKGRGGSWLESNFFLNHGKIPAYEMQILKVLGLQPSNTVPFSRK